MPLKWKPQFSIPRSDFQDALKLRFNIRPNDLPVICPAIQCSHNFDLTHADSCNIGGIVFRRHDYIKVILARYSEKVCGLSSTLVEPSLGALDESAKHMIVGKGEDFESFYIAT